MIAPAVAGPQIRVKVADFAVSAEPVTLVTIGLGSCVAVALHDASAGVGGLAHVLLPSESMSRDRGNRAKFAGTAVPLLVERMQALGARTARLQAKLAGGSSMFSTLTPAGGLQMGERNVLAVREALARMGIPIAAQDVGGEHGRSVYFSVGDGAMLVRSIKMGNVVL
ncbi:MAG TPA: chemotaxis protein CheD [Gemmatimonadaceae bacterium]|nr:chemotaxis protein CheD [Gemmatimonadaceae bacterium]